MQANIDRARVFKALLQNEFNSNDINRLFETDPAYKSAQSRIEWAYRKHGDGLVLISSFGTTSILNILAAVQTVPDIAIVHIDQPGDEYQKAREHRDFIKEALKRTLDFDLFVKYAVDIGNSNENPKIRATQDALKDLGATAFLRGTMRFQTPERSNMKIVENWVHDPRIEAIAPFADWSEAKVDKQIRGVRPRALVRDDYFDGVKTQGGAPVEVKTECGVHFVDGKLVRTNTGLSREDLHA